MTPKQMLSMVRKLINDEQATGFTEGGNLEAPEGTQELLTYLDRAVEEYSKRQAANRDIRQVKTMTISNNATLPNDFLMFCGVVPVNIAGGRLTYYGAYENMPVKYFARLPYVTSYSENAELPYERDQENTICALAAIFALNKHEFNVSQDLILAGYGAGNADTQQQA